MLSSILISLAMFIASASPSATGVSSVPIATHSMSMEDRYSNKFVNDVFKDNILLALNYMDGAVKSIKDVSWDNVEKQFHYEFTLNPGEEFVFDDAVLPEYKGNIVKSTNAHFTSNEGFKSDGFLVGDGVCHLASIIYWTAKDAHLDAYAPSNHNFANIPEVPREYGVAIYSPSPMGNLYITNNKSNSVKFVFDYNGSNLSVSVLDSK